MKLTADYIHSLSGEQLGVLKNISDTLLKLDSMSRERPATYSTMEWGQYAKLMEEDEADLKHMRIAEIFNKLKEERQRAAGLGLGELSIVKLPYVSTSRLINLYNPCGLLDRNDKSIQMCEKKEECAKLRKFENLNVCTRKWGWEVAGYMAKEGGNYAAQKPELIDGMKAQMAKDKKIMLDSGKVVEICNSALENILKETETHANNIYNMAKEGYDSLLNEATDFLKLYKMPRAQVSASPQAC